MWKIRNNINLWTACASDMEWVKFEHFQKSQEINILETLLKCKRQARLENATGLDSVDITSINARLNKAINLWKFKLKPKLYGGCVVKLSSNDLVSEKQLVKCNVKQISVNTSDAITGQGAAKGSDNCLLLEQVNKLDIYCSFKNKDTARAVHCIKPHTEQHQASVNRVPAFHGLDKNN